MDSAAGWTTASTICGDHTVAMLRQLWSELGLAAAPVLGNSLGGMAALHLALDDPSLVSHVVIFGQNVALPGGRSNLIGGLLAVPGIARLLFNLPSSPNWSRTISKPVLGPAALAQTPPGDVRDSSSRKPSARGRSHAFDLDASRVSMANTPAQPRLGRLRTRRVEPTRALHLGKGRHGRWTRDRRACGWADAGCCDRDPSGRALPTARRSGALWQGH